MQILVTRKNSNFKQIIQYEFHIAAEIRKKYKFDQRLFSISGNIIFANFSSVRTFVQKLNSKREDKNFVKSGEVNACGLIAEIYHFILREYEEEVNPKVFTKAVKHLEEKLSEESLRMILFDFISLFPPQEVYKGKVGAFEY